MRSVLVRSAQSGDGSGRVLEARFVVSAVGSLNIPRMPEIPGMDTFEGPSFHSARWPEDLDIRGTKFALVGAGASGFQIGPAIAPEVEQLTIFQRTAQWIIPNPLYHTAVPPGDEWALRHLPFYGRWYRFIMTFAGIAAGSEPYRIDPGHDDPSHQSINAVNAKRSVALLGWMQSIVADRPDLLDKITPDYPATGKRILQDNGTWLRTLHAAQRRARSGPAIERVVPDGVVTVDGIHHRADIICYATGFRHNDFLASMDVTGRGGAVLREQWGDEPTAYLGITVPRFPNLFCIYGPGTNLAARGSSCSPLHHSGLPGRITQAWRSSTGDAGVQEPGGAKSVQTPTGTTSSATSTRSGRWCGPIPPSPTVITRTAMARCSRCPRGRWTCTGRGPATWSAGTTTLRSPAESSTPRRANHNRWLQHRCNIGAMAHDDIIGSWNVDHRHRSYGHSLLQTFD